MKKIPTVFERVFEGHKIVDVLPRITPGCEEAFLHGVATLKMDGACCAIINGQMYKRYDAKPGRKPPLGAIPCQMSPDPITGHWPHWVQCSKDNHQDKYFFAAWNFYWGKHRMPDATYEAIGKHFNGNPYNLDYDTLYRHGETKLFVDRDFEAVKKFLQDHTIEGIVFWLNGVPVCKIKRTDFGFDWGAK